MSKETGGSAFPVPATEYHGCDFGMDLRDYFAAKAMEGDWASQDAYQGTFDNDISDEVLLNRSRLYWRMADAMLKTRGE